jgi:hypothetical protein
MNMKKKLFVLSALFFLITAALQSQAEFGILGGVNFQNLNGKDINGDKLENNMIIGYHAGVNVQIPVAPEFYFQPGLMFYKKGAKITDGSKIGLSYIELPLNLVYKAILGNGKFMLGFGPYFGYAIGGKVKPESGTATNIEFQSVVEAGAPSSVTYFKAFDAGANIFAGFEMGNGIFFQLDSQLGMLKINPEDKRITDDKSSVKNTGFGLSLGYRF